MSLILFIVSILITIGSQLYLKVVFSKYKKVANSKQLTGNQVASKILNAEGLSSIALTQSPAKLSDHYDPLNKKVGLSPEIYEHRTLLALAVAAHEVGHAIQDKKAYGFLRLRTRIFPVVSFASSLAPIIIIFSFFASSLNLLYIGIVCLAVTVVFALITLPVEIDASKRALAMIRRHNLATNSELVIVKKILTAAALTYVAAAAVALLELIRYIIIARSND